MLETEIILLELSKETRRNLLSKKIMQYNNEDIKDIDNFEIEAKIEFEKKLEGALNPIINEIKSEKVQEEKLFTKQSIIIKKSTIKEFNQELIKFLYFYKTGKSISLDSISKEKQKNIGKRRIIVK